jgi:hypothetical protein
MATQDAPDNESLRLEPQMRLSGNTASGTGTLVFVVSGTAVTSTWVAELIPWSVDGCGPCTPDVPAGVTVTVNPGVVVKTLRQWPDRGGGGQRGRRLVEPDRDGLPLGRQRGREQHRHRHQPQPGDWSGISIARGGRLAV